MVEDNYRHKGMRQILVDNLRKKGICDERVLEAVGRVPRHVFLNSSFLEHAYEDKAFSIGSGQTISMPSTVAFQTQALSLEKGMKVLEIGTGSGYQACVLAEMGAKVFTIERQRKLFAATKQLLSEFAYGIKCFIGDGNAGLPTYAPFDRIIITAGAPEIPQNLINQLKPNGVMVVPLNVGDEERMLRIVKNEDGEIVKEELGVFHFVPMLKNIGND